jgi:hypothetical protein
VVKEKDPPLPTVNVVAVLLVIAGASSTVSCKVWLAFTPMPFAAVTGSEYTPPVPPAGVPERSPPEVRVTPEGKVPVVENVGVG